MNKKILVLGLFLGLYNIAQGQVLDSLNYRVIYELTYQPDSTDVASKKSEVTWLFLGNEGSLYLSKPLALQDSLPKMTMADFNSDRMKKYNSKTKTDFDFKVIKNRKQEELYYTTKILEDKLYYTEPIGPLNWQVYSENKNISGYTVQKATTTFAGRDYVAWFTSEIPISDGPYKFNGLPGLILSIEDSQQHYVFSFAGFQKLPEPLLSTPISKKYQESSKKQLLDLKKRYDEDPISYINNFVGSGGKKVTVTLNNQDKKDYLKKRRAKLAKKNNPIELK